MKSLTNFLQTIYTGMATPLVIFAIFLLLFASCAKDYYPKQFPPVRSCPDLPVVTYGGEKYPTVLIENRCWMDKNLNIGTMISDTLKMTDNGVIEKYCYEADTTNCKIYGGLYQWDEVMQYQSDEGSQGICPEGWHIPTNREFVDLFLYVDNDHGFLIDNQDSLWEDKGYSENFNLSGFSVLPAGESYRSYDYADNLYQNHYHGLQNYAVFWCSKELDDSHAVLFAIGIPNEPVDIGTHFSKHDLGSSIRCIKDE
jgi:uncharacterized protein (TIGR02145 family)